MFELENLNFERIHNGLKALQVSSQAVYREVIAPTPFVSVRMDFTVTNLRLFMVVGISIHCQKNILDVLIFGM